MLVVILGPVGAGCGGTVAGALIDRFEITSLEAIVAFIVVQAAAFAGIFVLVAFGVRLLVGLEWRWILFFKTVRHIAWRRVKLPLSVFTILAAVWFASLVVISSHAHQGQTLADSASATTWHYLDVAGRLLSSTEVRPVVVLGAVLFVIVALGVDLYYHHRFRSRFHPALRDLLHAAKIIDDEIFRGENGDERIAQQLLQHKDLKRVIFAGSRFYGLFSRSALFLCQLREQSPNAEIVVVFHDPWEEGMFARLATLGYSRARGVLNPLEDCVQNVQEHFGQDAARMVCVDVSCRIVVATASNMSQFAILQPLRKVREARWSGGYILKSSSAPSVVELLSDLAEERVERAILLEERWILDPANCASVRAFAVDAGLVTEHVADGNCRRALLNHRYRRFIRRAKNIAPHSCQRQATPSPVPQGYGLGI